MSPAAVNESTVRVASSGTLSPAKNGGSHWNLRFERNQIIGNTQATAIQPIVPQTRTRENSFFESSRCVIEMELVSELVGR